VTFARDIARIELAAVIYNTTPVDARALATKIADVTGEPVETVRFGPVISTHVGPGVLGVVVKEAASD
jgi:fatty acid-binding protein DegV